MTYRQAQQNILDSLADGWKLQTSYGCFHSDVWLEKEGSRIEVDRSAANELMKSNKLKEIKDPVRSTTITSHFVLA